MSAKSNLPIRSLLRITALFSVLCATAQAADWPQWRGPNRDSVSPETGWLLQWPPEIVWTQSVGIGYASVAVSDGRVYTTGWETNVVGDIVTSDDVLWCLRARTGEVLWSRRYSCGSVEFEGTRATPTVYGNEVYTYTHEGLLICWDKVTGDERWRREVGAGRPFWGLSGSPLVDGDRVYVCAGGTGAAINRNPPYNVIWSGTNTGSYSSPVIFNWNSKRALAFLTEDGLRLSDSANGAELRHIPFGDSLNVADPIVYGNKLLVSYYAGSMLFDPALANPTNWATMSTRLRSDTQTPVIVGAHAYGIRRADSRLYCVKMSDGTSAWYKQLTRFEDGNLIAAEDKLIILAQNGSINVVLANPTAYNDGGRAWVSVFPGAEDQEWRALPALANGRIYCRSHEGTLVCLRTGRNFPVDDDRDGIGDGWETVHFAGTNACNPGADSDKDGASNESEYLAGTNPWGSNDTFKVSIALSNGTVVVACPTLPATGAGYEDRIRTYTLERANGPARADWHSVSGLENVPGNNRAISHNETGGTGGGAFRAKVKLE